jgi:hypothetical protein
LICFRTSRQPSSFASSRTSTRPRLYLRSDMNVSRLHKQQPVEGRNGQVDADVHRVPTSFLTSVTACLWRWRSWGHSLQVTASAASR